LPGKAADGDGRAARDMALLSGRADARHLRGIGVPGRASAVAGSRDAGVAGHRGDGGGVRRLPPVVRDGPALSADGVGGAADGVRSLALALDLREHADALRQQRVRGAPPVAARRAPRRAERRIAVVAAGAGRGGAAGRGRLAAAAAATGAGTPRRELVIL
ncbi:MAG: hypothetical protein AVDCRST_MAG89-4848, partial [uncultured Gemmatimonadetes bacterium]